MTNPISSAAIRAELTDNALALSSAREDAAMYERFKQAPANAERLAKRGNELTAMLAEVEETEAKAAREARFAGLKDLRITEVADKLGSGVLSSRFRINYTDLAWDTDASATLPRSVSRNGFAALPPHVFAWVCEVHPDKVPTSIMALAPDNVEAAFHRYFMGLQRGYLSS